jgi:hypothetical protein
MNSAHNNYNSDEISLKEILTLMWAGKFLILICIILSIATASYYLRGTERKYSVTYKLKPVMESNKGVSNLSQYSAVASFAGLDIPQEINEELEIFKELFLSVEVAERLFVDQKLVKELYSAEWNNEKNQYIEPPRGFLYKLIRFTDRTLAGSERRFYQEPTPRRLSNLIKSLILIGEDQDTGFLELVGMHSNPELMLSLIIKASNTADKIMRERYIKVSKDPLKYYKDKITTARSREHREALALLIGQEERKLMLASYGAYFIAEPFLRPVISMYPTSPNTKLTLFIAFILGFIISNLIIFLRNIFSTSEVSSK